MEHSRGSSDPIYPVPSGSRLRKTVRTLLGTLAGWGHTGAALATGVDPALIWPEIARVLDGLRRFEKARGTVNVTLLKDVGPSMHEAELRRSGYERADMQLQLGERWPTFEAYLSSLTSKSRNSVRRTVREVDEAGYVCRSLSAAEVAAAEPRIDQLYGHVWANAEVRPIRLSGRFFTQLKARLGDACEVVGIEKEGQLDGFGVALRNHDSCVGYYLGFERTAEAPLYLRLLLSMIETGIAWALLRLTGGSGSSTARRR